MKILFPIDGRTFPFYTRDVIDAHPNYEVGDPILSTLGDPAVPLREQKGYINPNDIPAFVLEYEPDIDKKYHLIDVWITDETEEEESGEFNYLAHQSAHWECEPEKERQFEPGGYPWMIQNPEWGVSTDPNLEQWISNENCLIQNCNGQPGDSCTTPGGAGLHQMRGSNIFYGDTSEFKPGHTYRIDVWAQEFAVDPSVETSEDADVLFDDIVATATFTFEEATFGCLDKQADDESYTPEAFYHDETMCTYTEVVPGKYGQNSWPRLSDEQSKVQKAEKEVEQPKADEATMTQETVDNPTQPNITTLSPLTGVSDRIFGADIPMIVKRKLEARQFLASKTRSPNQSVQSSYKKPGTDSINYSISDPALGMDLQFEGAADLSSRTPFARMWTAVQLSTTEQTRNWKYENEDEFTRDDENFIYRQKNDKVYEYKINRLAKKVYAVNSTDLTYPGQSGNELSQIIKYDSADEAAEVTDKLFPEQNLNAPTWNSAPTGITSVNSETMGSMGELRKITVNFLVHNFDDFQNIYQRFFLKPGANVFVDYGWSSQEIYDPEKLVYKEFNEGKTIEDRLYGVDGVVTKAAGDMETFNGFVTNYDSKYLENGSIECSIEIISKNNVLLTTNLNDFHEKKVKILETLDTKIVNFVANQFGKAFLEPNKSYNPESFDEWKEVALFFSNVLVDEDFTGAPNRIDNRLSTVAGIKYRTLKKIDPEDPTKEIQIPDTSDNIYVSFGLMEDIIFNQELAVASTYQSDDAVNFKLEFDSSNSFTTYDTNLKKMMESTDRKNFPYMYPDEWWCSYNVVRDKVPADRKIERLESGHRDARWKFLASSLNSIYREVGVNDPFADAGMPDHEIEADKRDKRNNRIPVRELFVNLGIIKEAIKTKSTVRQMMKFVLDKMNEQSQGIMNLQISTSKSAQTNVAVADGNFVYSERTDVTSYLDRLFTFSPYSKNSIINSFDISFSMPSDDISNMIALQSGFGGMDIQAIDKVVNMTLATEVTSKIGSDVGIQYLPETGEHQLRKFLKRSAEGHETILGQQYKDSKIFGGTNDELVEAALDSLAADYAASATSEAAQPLIYAAKNDYKKDATPGVIDTSGVEGDDSILTSWNEIELYPPGTILASTVSDYYANQAKSQYFRDTMSTVIPISLTLSMYGCGLLQPGDIFRVDHLPTTYREVVFFQTKSVSHQITNNQWTTTLETFMRISPQAKNDSGVYGGRNNFLSFKALNQEMSFGMEIPAYGPVRGSTTTAHSNHVRTAVEYEGMNTKHFNFLMLDKKTVLDVFYRLLPYRNEGYGKARNYIRIFTFQPNKDIKFKAMPYLQNIVIQDTSKGEMAGIVTDGGHDHSLTVSKALDTVLPFHHDVDGVCSYSLDPFKWEIKNKNNSGNAKGVAYIKSDNDSSIRWWCNCNKNKKYFLIVSKKGNWCVIPSTASIDQIIQIQNIYYFLERPGVGTERAKEEYPFSSVIQAGVKYNSSGDHPSDCDGVYWDPGGWCNEGIEWFSGDSRCWTNDRFSTSKHSLDYVAPEPIPLPSCEERGYVGTCFDGSCYNYPDECPMSE